jgi:glycosyltransferase involved in cell wall biosynthesis/peptidoglycan/xylan/chitin deacetylase (PgdA/CDA1 family)
VISGRHQRNGGGAAARGKRGRPRACIVRQTDWYEPPIQREAEALVEAGFDVEVLCMRKRGNPRRETVNGVELTMLPTSLTKSSKFHYMLGYAHFFVLAAGTLAARHLRRPYAVVQVNTMPDFLVFAAAVPKWLGSRVIAYMHEPTPELAETLFGAGVMSRWLARVEQRVLRFADHAVAVTDQHKERYVERGARPERISVVLNGPDPATRLAGWSRPETRAPTGKFTVISHGAVEDRYGQDTIIEAARLLRDELPDLEVVLVGRGSMVEETAELIRASQLEDVVRFEGWVSHERLNDLLHSADVGIVAQKASPYSHLVHTNKMVDYWIFGLPVIASRLRAVSQVHDDSVLEYYEPGDARDLARAIRRLHEDPARRAELARNGRLAEKRHGWGVQKRTYVGIYDALLNGGGPQRASAPSRRRKSPCRGVPPIEGRSAPPRALAEPYAAQSPLPRLERLLRPLVQADLDTAAGDGPATWLQAGEWKILARPRTVDNVAGDVIERFHLPSGRDLRAVRRPDGTVYVPFDLDEAYQNYVTEAWRSSTHVRALSQRQLQIYYRVKRMLPRAFWLHARRAFISFGSPPAFPAWPLERAVEHLVRFAALCLLEASDADEASFAWFWPRHHSAALILTHDVESGAGLRRALELADLEEARGLRSSFNIVGEEYDIDPGITRELVERGFEIGLHGLRHDLSLFSSRAEFERQLPRLAAAARRLGAQGFRSPSTHRIADWLHELPVGYDCSVPHSDPYEPRPGGSCTLWPYLLGEVVELPYTLPQDHTLFTLLRKRSVEPWLELLAQIEQRAGLIQCVSHPDPGYLGDADKRAIYAEFLDAVAARDQLWKPLPREVADWWRRRALRQTTAPEQLLGRMRRGSAPDYAYLQPPDGGAELSAELP